jgi:hypothetical protein
MALRTADQKERGSVDYARKIEDLIEFAEKYAALCGSPKRVEFKFCALLAAWESAALHDSKASHWYELWQQHCLVRHRGKSGRTLADPIAESPRSKQRRMSADEEARAYAKVKEGLRHVFNSTLHHYRAENDAEASLAEGSNEPAILFQKIRDSFELPQSFSSPEGMEVFLMTLIELFEQSLVNKDDLFSSKIWRSEIYRRRLGGLAETKTLADVASPEIRSERQNVFSETERTEILQQMLSAMREITKQLHSYLDKCGS